MSIADLPELRSPPAATAAQMAEADRVAASELGIPLEVLMENAARQIAAATRSFRGSVDGRRVVAVCGTGNNGGDALGALRHLHGWGAQVEAVVAAPRDRLRPLAALQLDILDRLGVPCDDAGAMDDAAIVDRLRAADVLLDGLLGYSASGAPRGEIARLIALMTGGRREGRIVAVDLPSGLDPDTGATLNGGPAGAVRAALTVTLALPKTGLLRAEAREWVGDLVLADIGIPAKAYEGLGIAAQRLFADGDLVRIIP
ncbi:MAG TPA: NAD(P)H-hydrate epimerase [Candidatus Limnocylindria bacterium]|nr:NAD(P)H-hydrate epimerase [Candidatus Limnocylindria bacterium]